MYRAVTLYLIDAGIELRDTAAIRDALSKIQIVFKRGEKSQQVWLNGVDVTKQIRMPRVAAKVSEVATIGLVRDDLVARQRLLAAEQDIVMDGRDIGTVVFPDADLKIFVTASIDERVSRRLQELKAKGVAVEYEAVKANLLKRDHIDSTRDHSPLRRANDAYLLDNTLLTRDEQLSVALKLVDNRR
jgi:cytidylate kinase